MRIASDTFKAHQASRTPYRQGDSQRILLRVLDPQTGKLLQVIEPDALSKDNWVPSLHAGYGTLVIYGKSGASILRGKGGNAARVKGADGKR